MENIIIKDNLITLVQYLKREGIISTGGEVVHFLDNNKVLLNEVSVFEKRKKMYDGDILQINDQKYIIKSENKES